MTGYFAGERSAAQYAADVVAEGGDFAPFNLMLVERQSLYHASNRAGAAQLGAGLHAFSNAPPAEEWPKTETARAGLERLLALDAPLERLFELLAERADAATPEHRYRTAHFIIGDHYGTRCSTVVLVDAHGTVTFAERSFDVSGRATGEIREQFTLDGR